jgi:hypothetical protein
MMAKEFPLWKISLGFMFQALKIKVRDKYEGPQRASDLTLV